MPSLSVEMVFLSAYYSKKAWMRKMAGILWGQPDIVGGAFATIFTHQSGWGVITRAPWTMPADWRKRSAQSREHVNRLWFEFLLLSRVCLAPTLCRDNQNIPFFALRSFILNVHIWLGSLYKPHVAHFKAQAWDGGIKWLLLNLMKLLHNFVQ